MTLNEAIIHAEKVVRKNDREADRCNRHGGSVYKEKAKSCKACADEHRQLAEWLNELKRARVLLKATYELLMKQNDSVYVLNLLRETIFYDEAECDGCCLMEDIENLLEYHV